MTREDVEALAAEINALSPPARLRLAADLMEIGQGSTALPIIQRVAGELSLVLLRARAAVETGR